MQNLSAVLSPDSSLLDEIFVKSCLVYFDHIIVPPFSDAGISYRKNKDDALLFEKAGFNLELDEEFLQRYRLIRKIHTKLKHLESAGVVKRSIGILPTPLEALDILNAVMQHIPADLEVINAASTKPTVGLGGLSLRAKDTNLLESKRLDYLIHSTLRMFGALKGKHHIATNSLVDYEALIKIQELAFSQAQLSSLQVHPHVKEIIRLTVPRLIARDIEDVIEIRERLRDFLPPFRVEISRIAANVPEDILPTKWTAEIRTLIDKEISPKLLELERYLAKPHKVLNKYLVSESSAIGTASITLVASVLTGGNIGLAALAAPFTHLFTSILSAQQEMSEKKSANPLTFAVLAETIPH